MLTRYTEEKLSEISSHNEVTKSYKTISAYNAHSLHNLRQTVSAKDMLRKILIYWMSRSLLPRYTDGIYSDIKCQILFGFFQVDIEVIDNSLNIRIASTAHCAQDT